MTHPARLAGEFSICHATIDDPDGDAWTYRTLRWNFDDAESALRDVERVAAQEGVDPAECVVVQVYERQA